MTDPVLSVCLSCFNHAEYLVRQLAAFERQDYRPVEFVLVDDGSTDDTYEVMQAFARRNPNTRVIRHECNRGLIPAYTNAIGCATGDFVFAAASDDEVQPGFFSQLMKIAGRHPACGVVFCDALWRRGGEIATQQFGHSEEPRYFSPDEFAEVYRTGRMRFIPGQTVMWRRDALKAVGNYRTEFGVYCDFVITWALAFRYGVCYVPRPLSLATLRGADQWSQRQSRDRARVRASSDAVVAAFAGEEFSDIRRLFLSSRVIAQMPQMVPALVRRGLLFRWVSPLDAVRMVTRWLATETVRATGIYGLIRSIFPPRHHQAGVKEVEIKTEKKEPAGADGRG